MATVTLLAAALAACVALLNSRDAERRWRLDNRREAYQEFLSAVGELQHAAIWTHAPGQSPRMDPADFADRQRLLRVVHTQLQRLMLVAPLALASAGEDIFDTCASIASRTVRDELHEVLRLLNPQRAAFVAAARTDLATGRTTAILVRLRVVVRSAVSRVERSYRRVRPHSGTGTS